MYLNEQNPDDNASKFQDTFFGEKADFQLFVDPINGFKVIEGLEGSKNVVDLGYDLPETITLRENDIYETHFIRDLLPHPFG